MLIWWVEVANKVLQTQTYRLYRQVYCGSLHLFAESIKAPKINNKYFSTSVNHNFITFYSTDDWKLHFLSLYACKRNGKEGPVLCLVAVLSDPFATPWTVACHVPLPMEFECVAMPTSMGSSQPRNQTQVSHIAGGLFTIWATREALERPWSEVKSLSRVQLFATPWTVAHQAPPSMGFSRQEYWSGLPFPSPGDLPEPGIKPRSPTLQAGALTSEPPGKPQKGPSFPQTKIMNIFKFEML